MNELDEKTLSWAEAQAHTWDRVQWCEMIVALCPSWDEEDKSE